MQAILTCVEGKDGKWYGVFLGIRPNEKAIRSSGAKRSSFRWIGAVLFPCLKTGLSRWSPSKDAGGGRKQARRRRIPALWGTFLFTDDFAGKALDNRWVGIRCNPEDFVSFVQGGLRIEPFWGRYQREKAIVHV